MSGNGLNPLRARELDSEGPPRNSWGVFLLHSRAQESRGLPRPGLFTCGHLAAPPGRTGVDGHSHREPRPFRSDPSWPSKRGRSLGRTVYAHLCWDSGWERKHCKANHCLGKRSLYNLNNSVTTRPRTSHLSRKKPPGAGGEGESRSPRPVLCTPTTGSCSCLRLSRECSENATLLRNSRHRIYRSKAGPTALTQNVVKFLEQVIHKKGKRQTTR